MYKCIILEQIPIEKVLLKDRKEVILMTQWPSVVVAPTPLGSRPPNAVIVVTAGLVSCNIRQRPAPDPQRDK